MDLDGWYDNTKMDFTEIQCEGVYRSQRKCERVHWAAHISTEIGLKVP
jgi:hypothetical protein